MHRRWFRQVRSQLQRSLCPPKSTWYTGYSGQRLSSIRSSSRLHSVTIAMLSRFRYRLFPVAAQSSRTHQVRSGHRPRRLSPRQPHLTFQCRIVLWYRCRRSGMPPRWTATARPSLMLKSRVERLSLTQPRRPRGAWPCWFLDSPRMNLSKGWSALYLTSKESRPVSTVCLHPVQRVQRGIRNCCSRHGFLLSL